MAFLIPTFEENGLGTVGGGMATWRITAAMNGWWWAAGATGVTTAGVVGASVGTTQANKHKHDKIDQGDIMPSGLLTVYGAAPSNVPHVDPRPPYFTHAELSELLSNDTSTPLTVTRSAVNSTAGIFLPFPPHIQNASGMVEHYVKQCGRWECKQLMPAGIVPEFITDNNETNTDASIMLHKLKTADTNDLSPRGEADLPSNPSASALLHKWFFHHANTTNLSSRTEANSRPRNMTLHELNFLRAISDAVPSPNFNRTHLPHHQKNPTHPSNLTTTNLTSNFLTHTYTNFLHNLAANHTLIPGGLLGPSCSPARSSAIAHPHFHTRPATLTRPHPDGHMVVIEGRFVHVNEETISVENRAKFATYVSKFARGEMIGWEGSEFMFVEVMGFDGGEKGEGYMEKD